MYKYIVGLCYWKQRETAEARHDLIVADVRLFETTGQIFDNVWPPQPEPEFSSCEIILNLNDLQSLSISSVSGRIPGDVINSPYDLASKMEKARNVIVSRALGICLKDKVVRSVE